MRKEDALIISNAEKQKAYRQRRQAEGRFVSIYVPNSIYNLIKGKPSVLVDEYAKSHNIAYSSNTKLVEKEGKNKNYDVDNKVTKIVTELQINYNTLTEDIANIKGAIEATKNITELKTEITKLQDTYARLELDITTFKESVIEKKNNKEVTKYNNQVINKETKRNKIQGEKTYDAWLSEFEERKAKTEITETDFAKEKGIPRSTMRDGLNAARKRRREVTTSESIK